MADPSWNLVITGFTLGLVHVLAGPDHLSALAALSVGTSYKAFLLGFRWGIGHSTGLIAVAVVFISLKGDLDIRKIGRYCDSLVGLFMIVLGCYGIMNALKMNKQKQLKSDMDLETVQWITKSDSGSSAGSSHSSPESKGLLIPRDQVTSRSYTTLELLGFHDHDIAEECPMCSFIDMNDSTTQRMLSFCIGLLHGVAGPGGILGVLPAVEMQNWRSASIYLGSFILSSTFSMGAFAALYGECTRRLGATAQAVDFALRLLSAAISVLVGTIWFVLSVLGKLEDWFH
jgi:hypothetical protein